MGFLLNPYRLFIPISGNIQFVGKISAGGNGNISLDLNNLTGGIATAPSPNDFVVMFGGKAHSLNYDVQAVTSSYTEIFDLYVNDVQDVNLGVFCKLMTATPDTTAVLDTGGTNTNGGVAMAAVFRGVNQTTPLDVLSTSANGIDGNLANPPAITPSSPGAWIMAIYAGSNDPTMTAATGPANMTDFFEDSSGGTTSRLQIGMALKKDWTSNAFDPDPWSGTDNETSTSWAGVSLALRPA